MKIRLSRATLAAALDRVTKVVETRQTIPILSHVLVRPSGGIVQLVATDLDIEARTEVEANTDGATAFTVQAALIADIARKLPDGDVTIEGDPPSGSVQIAGGRARFRLATLPEEDFPDFVPPEKATAFQIPKADLQRLLDLTRFAISNEELRYYLNGVFLHATADEGRQVLRAVATDGHRLARVDVDLPAGAEGLPGVIIPRKTVAEIIRLLKDAPDAIALAISDSKIRLEFGATVLTSKLIDGTFPDYARVVPTNNETKATLEVEAVRQAIDRVTTISERGKAIRLAFAEGLLTLSITNPDAGEASDELAVTFDHPALEVGFNPRYLAEILGVTSAEAVEIAFGDAGGPALLRNQADERALFVLMPMRY